MSDYTNEFKEIEKQYADLVKSFDFILTDESFYYNAVSLIEKCEMFWTSKRTQISIMLEELASENCCFVLTGAIYLNVEDNCHYEFAALGDYHFLNDPFVRMRGFFLNGENSVTVRLKEYFLDAYQDTVDILNGFSEHFYFISLDILCAPQYDERKELCEKACWDVISYALNKEYQSLEELESDFNSINDIEKAMAPEFRDHFIYTNSEDICLSLKERIDKYFEYNQVLIPMDCSNDIVKFYISTMAQIQQAVDISLKCTQFNLHPYIRFEITFHYLIMLLECFRENESVNNLFFDVVISYLFSNFVIGDEINRILFDDYVYSCSDGKLFDTMISILKTKGFNALAVNITEVVATLTEKYLEILNE